MHLTIDIDAEKKAVKAIHGVNLGPIDNVGWGFDVSSQYRDLQVPSVRIHDAAFISDMVDLHCVFPDPSADADDPNNYQFALTDQYLDRIRATGADVYFRLGESIELWPAKRYITPDRWTPERMARVCVNIMRHYNHGWADGFAWGIRNWEFWNEPENRSDLPPGERLCWTGSAEQFFDFYRAAAIALKEADTSIKVGLAGFLWPWFTLPDDHPEYRQAWGKLIPRCVDERVPVDFVSWHRYTDSWADVVHFATETRRYLDALGLRDAESHLTEWNYNPTLSDDAGEYSVMSARLASEGVDRYERAEAASGGLAAAAFVFGTLAALQDAPVEEAHLYTGSSSYFGLFEVSGRPKIKFEGFSLFAGLAQLPGQRVDARTDEPATISAMAVRVESQVHIGVAHLNHEAGILRANVKSSQGLGAIAGRVGRLTNGRWIENEVTADEAGIFDIRVAAADVLSLTFSIGEPGTPEPRTEVLT